MKQETFEVLVPRNGVVADILPALQRKANLNEDAIAKIRIYEAQSCKVYKELDGNFSVTALNEFVTLYAEKIPEEELKADESDRFICAFHFDKEPNKTHSVPFRFLVKHVSLSRADGPSLRTLNDSRTRLSRIPKNVSRGGQVSRVRTSRR